MDPDPDRHGSAYILPPRFGSLSTFNMRIRIQRGKFWEKKMKKCKEISNNSSFIQKSKYWSIVLVFINTVYRFFYKFCKAVSGSGSPLRKLLDPDPLKLNADPQPSLLSSSYFIWPVLRLWGVTVPITQTVYWNWVTVSGKFRNSLWHSLIEYRSRYR